MSFYKLTKILLPFFPDNNWLRQHWWHRLALVFSSGVSLVTIFLSVSLVISGLSEGIYVIILIILLVPISAIGFFGPNILYRAVLYIFTNDSWRESE